MSGGIYKIVNTVNRKVYIGSAKNFEVRKNRHFNDLHKGIHGNRHLQKSYNKYGDVFEFIEIQQLGEYNKSLYFKEENKWMSYYNSRNSLNGYNMAAVDGGGRHLGCKHSEETKSIISRKLLENHPTRGKPLSDEHKEKIRQSNLGKTMSQESIEKNRVWQLKHNPRRGIECSDEHKEKISIALSGDKHWNKGGTTSEKQKQAARLLWSTNNPRATAVSIDGIIYKTQTEARNKLHVSRKVMYNRLHSDKPEWSNWILL